MKQLFLIIMFLFLSNNITLANDNEYDGGPTRYTYRTSCGAVAVSYSYEPVSAEDLNAWADAMEVYLCEEL
jgi:hypothetical protein